MEYGRDETKKVEIEENGSKLKKWKKIYKNHGKLQRYADI